MSVPCYHQFINLFQTSENMYAADINQELYQSVSLFQNSNCSVLDNNHMRSLWTPDDWEIT